MTLLSNKKQAVFLIILGIVSTVGYSQQVRFKEIRLRPDSKIFNTKDSTIIYPVVVAKNAAISKKINNEIRDVVFGDYDSKQSLVANLKNQTREGLINLSYEISFNKNDLLSFRIYYEGCGAYCSSYYEYLNFDLKTGRRISIADIISPHKLETFKSLVATDKTRSLNEYKKVQLEAYNKKEIDSTNYDWIMEQVDSNCINVIDINNFALTNRDLEIFDGCEFPHVIRALQPIYHLQFPLKKIQGYLNPKMKSRLLK